MDRFFAFKLLIKFQTRLRQIGKCACCGDQLDNVEEHAHHVIPNQSGKANNPSHLWLASIDNCVVLCAMCHKRVHQNGNYRAGGIAPPSYYPYSHGMNRAAHQIWINSLTRMSKTIWP